MILFTARGPAIGDDFSSDYRWSCSRAGRKTLMTRLARERTTESETESRATGGSVRLEARTERGRGESCAYPKLSDSRSSAQRAPVVPRVVAHVPSREKPTTDCQRSSSVPDRGAGGCGRWERCEVRGKVDGGGCTA